MKIICNNCRVEYDSTDGMYCPNCGTRNNQTVFHQNENTNGFCIAGLILSFFSGIMGLIFSLIGLNKIKTTKEKGKGVAIAGIIMSSVRIVFTLIYVIAVVFFAIFLAADYDSDVSISSLCERAVMCEYNYYSDTYSCLYEDDYGDYQYITCNDVDADVVTNYEDYFDEDYYWDNNF